MNITPDVTSAQPQIIQAQPCNTQAKPSLIHLMLSRITGMFAVRPVMNNLIALGLASLVLYYLFFEVSDSGFLHYQSYFCVGIQLFAALQIIKSGTRSLLLPFSALILGGIAAHTLEHHQTLLYANKAFYDHLMIVGMIGLAASILTID
jgi:hypothetical protein